MSFRLFTNSISLSSVDGSKVLRIPIFPISDEPLTHPKAGSMVFDLPFAEKIIANFRAYPGEVPLDFDHGVENASGDGEAIAAGWIKKLVIEGSEVVAYAEPTARALSKVEAKEYKLSSASLSFDWQNPQNGNHCGPVLLSVALTNRPFIRGLGSVVSIDKGNVSLKDREMSTISLADHTKKVEEVTAKLTAAETQTVSLNTQLNEIKVSLADATGKLEKAETQIKELETEKRKAVALSDVEKLITAGKAVPAEKDSLVELHLSNNDLFVKLTKDRPVMVNMTAKGAGGNNSERSAADKGRLLVEKANEIAEKEKVEFSDALRIARKRNPDLAESI